MDTLVCPQQADHGPMVVRPIERQTPEQRWCGTWHDCSDPRCHASTLDPSEELNASLAAQRERVA
jgi:hypothetical protein